MRTGSTRRCAGCRKALPTLKERRATRMMQALGRNSTIEMCNSCSPESRNMCIRKQRKASFHFGPACLRAAEPGASTDSRSAFSCDAQSFARGIIVVWECASQAGAMHLVASWVDEAKNIKAAPSEASLRPQAAIHIRLQITDSLPAPQRTILNAKTRTVWVPFDHRIPRSKKRSFCACGNC